MTERAAGEQAVPQKRKMLRFEKGIAWVKGNVPFSVLFLCLACYYLWRLFAMPPWYDELYTYEMFIDRGVVYSMIHWPLPNNHVFFSALSAAVNKLGSPWLGLRGVSFAASLGSLLLLYRILKKAVEPFWAFLGTGLFAGMYHVTQQAVQGRGYALSGFFLLGAVNLLYEICVPGEEAVSLRKSRVWYYIGFAACLTGGLYTIPSNLYWVVPICLAGGFFLLICRDYGRLGRLIAASAGAAAVTFGLYTVIWLAIGSNFLVKEEGSIYYGMGHVQMILRAPAAAFLRGMRAMLSDPNIQSVDRGQFLDGIGSYLMQVLDQVYHGGAGVLAVLIPAALAVMLVQSVRAFRQKERTRLFASLYCVILTVMVPVFLFLQCVFPYLRVFTYMGSVLAMLFTLAGYRIFRTVRKRWLSPPRFPQGKRMGRAGGILPAAAVFCLLFVCLIRPSYHMGYDSRDNHIYAALRQMDETKVDTVLVGDVYARLNLYFHLEKCRGKALIMTDEQPDYVLMDKIQTGPEGNGLIWPYERDTEDFPWEWIEKNMEVVFEDDAYIAYQIRR